jgi:heparanase
MAEVTGGRFWKPYKDIAALLQARDSAKHILRMAGRFRPGWTPASISKPSPIHLTNARLRKLAGALGPACVRMSGTWANTTYFHDPDQPAPKRPPKCLGGVLTSVLM